MIHNSNYPVCCDEKHNKKPQTGTDDNNSMYIIKFLSKMQIMCGYFVCVADVLLRGALRITGKSAGSPKVATTQNAPFIQRICATRASAEPFPSFSAFSALFVIILKPSFVFQRLVYVKFWTDKNIYDAKQVNP